MPGTRSKTMDVREILRRIREGQSNRAIARATGVNRKTVGRYRAWAAKHRLLEGGLPSLEELHQLLDGVKIAAIGPVTAETVRKNGLTVDIQPNNYTISDMVDAIVDHYRTDLE